MSRFACIVFDNNIVPVTYQYANSLGGKGNTVFLESRLLWYTNM